MAKATRYGHKLIKGGKVKIVKTTRKEGILSKLVGKVTKS